jgi:hypothetical protein
MLSKKDILIDVNYLYNDLSHRHTRFRRHKPCAVAQRKPQNLRT